MSDYIQLTAFRGHINLQDDYIQLAAIIGNHNTKNDCMHKDDFYTLCQKKPQNNIGLRKQSKHKHGEIIFYSSDVNLEYFQVSR